MAVQRVVVHGMCAAGHPDRIHLREGEQVPAWLEICNLNIRDEHGRITRVCGARMRWPQQADAGGEG